MCLIARIPGRAWTQMPDRWSITPDTIAFSTAARACELAGEWETILILLEQVDGRCQIPLHPPPPLHPTPQFCARIYL